MPRALSVDCQCNENLFCTFFRDFFILSHTFVTKKNFILHVNMCLYTWFRWMFLISLKVTRQKKFVRKFEKKMFDYKKICYVRKLQWEGQINSGYCNWFAFRAIEMQILVDDTVLINVKSLIIVQWCKAVSRYQQLPIRFGYAAFINR